MLIQEVDAAAVFLLTALLKPQTVMDLPLAIVTKDATILMTVVKTSLKSAAQVKTCFGYELIFNCGVW